MTLDRKEKTVPLPSPHIHTLVNGWENNHSLYHKIKRIFDENPTHKKQTQTTPNKPNNIISMGKDG